MGHSELQIMMCDIAAQRYANLDKVQRTVKNMAQPVWVTAVASGIRKKNEELSRRIRPCICLAVLLCITSVLFLAMQLIAQVVSLDPAKMPVIGTVDERFQSYNIEMVEVIGGRFWKPYGNTTNRNKAQDSAPRDGFTPAGIDPNLYRYRAPIDLSNPRLRKLAEALSPAYVRVSGTWANSAYFQDSENAAPANAPSGFSGVLTQEEWKGVIDFSHAVNAEIVTSVATGPGSRDAQGVWTSDQARQLFEFTESAGGRIAASEFMNEPTYAAMGGAPKGYDAASFGRDVAVFRTFLRKTAPDTLFLGPGSVGEGPFAMPMGNGVLKSEDLLHAAGPVFDVFSYHLYAAASQRCASMGGSSQTTAAAALSQDWLSRPEKIGAFYADLRDRFEPGNSLWITETADAACGGNPWSSSFLDTFRYLLQHASLAQRGVKVIMHNTLASSDYGLLDENTFAPRPNYWAALLWRRLMGATVLDPQTSPIPNLYVYAHCLQNRPGGVTLLVINTDRQQVHEITLPSDAQRYTLTAKQLQDTSVQLNGKTLQLKRDGDLPQFLGQSTRAGHISFAPISITFLEIANADNNNCH
jgi:heparanase 1